VGISHKRGGTICNRNLLDCWGRLLSPDLLVKSAKSFAPPPHAFGQGREMEELAILLVGGGEGGLEESL